MSSQEACYTKPVFDFELDTDFDPRCIRVRPPHAADSRHYSPQGITTMPEHNPYVTNTKMDLPNDEWDFVADTNTGLWFTPTLPPSLALPSIHAADPLSRQPGILRLGPHAERYLTFPSELKLEDLITLGRSSPPSPGGILKPSQPTTLVEPQGTEEYVPEASSSSHDFTAETPLEGYAGQLSPPSPLYEEIVTPAFSVYLAVSEGPDEDIPELSLAPGNFAEDSPEHSKGIHTCFPSSTSGDNSPAPAEALWASISFF